MPMTEFEPQISGLEAIALPIEPQPSALGVRGVGLIVISVLCVAKCLRRG